ncbi:hypothetical protein EVAR_102325_1 [Eumeta japonica]|uniref:Pre-C2HC domain-containing protein n=1 Tax=Eumeta variegata TaxID=151549 RepID=A0A4C1ZI82_EUMVA|nr:hypothetical protein EVAR_102325_1 [Eumeta japonica]
MASLTMQEALRALPGRKRLRSQSRGKRTASSALSSDDSEVSDTTIRGSDDDASEFQLVKPRKIKNKTRRQRVSKTDSDDTETEPISTAPINFEDPPVSPTHLKLEKNPTDSIKITVPTTTHFRGINNYLININIVFHTHPLEEEHKVKAIIHGIPVEFTIDQVMTDLGYQGYAIHLVHRLHQKDGTSVGLVLSGLNKAVNIKDIYKILKSMRPLHHHRRRPLQEKRARAVPPLPAVWLRRRVAPSSCVLPQREEEEIVLGYHNGIGKGNRPPCASSATRQQSGCLPKHVPQRRHQNYHVRPPSGEKRWFRRTTSGLWGQTEEDQLAVILAHQDQLAKFESL